jgi:YidC/Oxa1 family membrane protein insertase
MNRTETAAVVFLFILLLGWGYWQKTHYVPPQPKSAAAAQTNTTAAATQNAATQAISVAAQPLPKEPVIKAPEPEKPGEGHHSDEKIVALSTDLMDVRVSSWGGGIVSVDLKSYKETMDKNSGPVRLDFSGKQALSFSDRPEISSNRDFDVTLLQDAKTILVERTTEEGLYFRRTITVTNGYVVQVLDSFSNSTPAALTLPPYGIAVGPMHEMASFAAAKGIGSLPSLGLDTLPASGGESLKCWSSSLPGFFGVHSSMGCARPNVSVMPVAATNRVEVPVSWVAAKNKFFVQILAPSLTTSDCRLYAERSVTVSNSLLISTVSADLMFPEKALQPGEAFEDDMSYYVGPKDYSSLKPLANHKVEVMEFGKWFGWLCPPLLLTMNAIYKVLPNYGVAVILLTCLVRLILWPITRKAMQSMKEMQKVQPLVNKLREEYKDRPQKLNEAIMALYKEHKVNPMAGCLPMALQIPVFIALYTMLRSSVELRYASFLWIRDLSEPENLFAGTGVFSAFPLSVVGSLNLLPILMTATAIWQQRLTPTTGDPQQQKMMMIMMPVVFLVMSYNWASGLMLYWTVSQLLSIAGMLWQRRGMVPAEPAK